MKRVLVTGGAGFVGGNLCVGLAERHPDWAFVALDNLRRRGSELNLPRLTQAGVAFVHGDVRTPEDLSGLGPVTAWSSRGVTTRSSSSFPAVASTRLPD